MKYIVASNHEANLKFYGQPIFVNQTKDDFIEATVRSLKVVKDPKVISQIAGKELVILGTFDDNTGKFDLLESPEKVLTYNDYLNVETEESEAN